MTTPTLKPKSYHEHKCCQVFCGLRCEETFIDIGVPEDYYRAQNLSCFLNQIKRHMQVEQTKEGVKLITPPTNLKIFEAVVELYNKRLYQEAGITEDLSG